MPYGSLNQRKGNHGFSSNFRDKQTDIVTYRGAICNQKGFPMVIWSIGKVSAKNQSPNSKNEKVVGIFIHFRNRQTDIVA